MVVRYSAARKVEWYTGRERQGCRRGLGERQVKRSQLAEEASSDPAVPIGKEKQRRMAGPERDKGRKENGGRYTQDELIGAVHENKRMIRS